MVRQQPLEGRTDSSTGWTDYSQVEEYLREEVPFMDGEAVERMVARLVPMSTIRESISEVSDTREPEITRYDDGRAGVEIEFQLNCGSSSDAHFLGRKLTTCYAQTRGAVRYSIVCRRALTVAESEMRGQSDPLSNSQDGEVRVPVRRSTGVLCVDLRYCA